MDEATDGAEDVMPLRGPVSQSTIEAYGRNHPRIGGPVSLIVALVRPGVLSNTTWRLFPTGLRRLDAVDVLVEKPLPDAWVESDGKESALYAGRVVFGYVHDPVGGWVIHGGDRVPLFGQRFTEKVWEYGMLSAQLEWKDGRRVGKWTSDGPLAIEEDGE